MRIGGLLKNSWIDFPGRVACVVFTPGCNFACPYCHNPDLVTCPGPDNAPREADVFTFLEKRKNLLDGVVISGGEPTLRKGLESFCIKLKTMGFQVKLDTNGTCPQIIESLLDKSLVDYVAMDVKSSPGEYSRVAGRDVDLSAIFRSIDLIMGRAPSYEFRTTCVRPFVDAGIMAGIGEMIRGARLYILQGCSCKGLLLDPEFFDKGSVVLTPLEILALKDVADRYVETCTVR
ncbi:MAG: anaerobic ribonucleoside-triphosphate reductase activating protein [Pseudomonadota bacterium]